LGGQKIFKGHAVSAAFEFDLQLEGGSMVIPIGTTLKQNATRKSIANHKSHCINLRQHARCIQRIQSEDAAKEHDQARQRLDIQ
jgi:hypothetical protein